MEAKEYDDEKLEILYLKGACSLKEFIKMRFKRQIPFHEREEEI